MEYEVKVEVPDTEDAEAIFDGKFKYLDQSYYLDLHGIIINNRVRRQSS